MIEAEAPIEPSFRTNYYSLDEAARRLDLTHKTLWRWVTDHKLTAVRFGVDRRWYVPRSEVERLRVARRQPAPIGGPFLSRDEAAEALGVSDRTLRRWLTSGRLRAIKRGESRTDPWRIPEAEVERVRNGGMLRRAAS